MNARVAATATGAAPPASLSKPPRDRGVLIRRLVVPATLLGRLAIDRRFQGQGAGEYLLMDALHRSLQASRQGASLAVIVDAKDERAMAFYRYYEFIPFADQPTRLFLPMSVIEKLFP